MKRLLLIFLSGCVSTSLPVKVGPDTYSISVTADGMRTAASAKNQAYNVARDHCGGDFEVLQENTYPTRMGIDTTTDIVFRCGPRS